MEVAVAREQVTMRPGVVVQEQTNRRLRDRERTVASCRRALAGLLDQLDRDRSPRRHLPDELASSVRGAVVDDLDLEDHPARLAFEAAQGLAQYRPPVTRWDHHCELH